VEACSGVADHTRQHEHMTAWLYRLITVPSEGLIDPTARVNAAASETLSLLKNEKLVTRSHRNLNVDETNDQCGQSAQKRNEGPFNRMDGFHSGGGRMCSLTMVHRRSIRRRHWVHQLRRGSVESLPRGRVSALEVLHDLSSLNVP